MSYRDIFMLQHVPTGLYMPMQMSRTSARGWSHWEPTDKEVVIHNPNPRIFYTRKGADNARVLWAQGPFVRQYNTRGTGLFGDEGDEVDVVPTKPLVPRQKSDLRIVCSAFLLPDD